MEGLCEYTTTESCDVWAMCSDSSSEWANSKQQLGGGSNAQSLWILINSSRIIRLHEEGGGGGVGGGGAAAEAAGCCVRSVQPKQLVAG